MFAIVAFLGSALMCVGCGSSATTRTVTQTRTVKVRATTPQAPPLTLSATCERWEDATAAQQRALAAKRAGIRGITIAAYVEQLGDACTPSRKALTLSEAIAADNKPPADPFATTRISGQLAAYVAKSVRSGWNACGPDDVCIAGTYAYSVGCHQPDPQVRILSCFVTTDKQKGGEGYGYTVKATVNKDGSFSWGLDNS